MVLLHRYASPRSRKIGLVEVGSMDILHRERELGPKYSAVGTVDVGLKFRHKRRSTIR